MTDLNQDEDHNHWNEREKKRPWLLYILLIMMCVFIAWVLSSTGRS